MTHPPTLLRLVLIPLLASGARAGTVFLNEIHYDNTGGDVGEFVEVAGPAGTDLSTWSVAFYNGLNGSVYATLPLSGVLPDQQGGFGTLAFDHAGIQNGAPDGLALVHGSDVRQFLSYEGSFAAVGGPADGMSSTDIGVAESGSTPAGHSLQLFGSGSCYEDFVWGSPASESPGRINRDQRFVGARVPDGGSSLALLFLSLACLGPARRLRGRG